MRCSSCGAETAGNFCSQCGTPLSGKPTGCPKCGEALEPGAAFCGNCGQPVGPRTRKPLSAHLPWLLSFVVLAAFALGIAWFVQQQSRARIGDDPITGGLPESGSGGAGDAVGGMPDLGSMSPRQAADRLFDRAMRESEAGNAEQASMFANMSLQAYGSVPPEQMDLDALFHVGLLHLAIGDTGTARAIAEGLLEDDENHLLALVLARRASAAAGDAAAEEGYAARLRAAVEAGELEQPDRPEYQQHRALIESEAGIRPAESSSESLGQEGAGEGG